MRLSSFFLSPFILSPFVLASVGLSATACSSSEQLFENSAASEQAIMYGSPDTTHQAVVALLMNVDDELHLCSGTIIDVKGSSGYVLTAAHCLSYSGVGLIEPSKVVVVMGNDFADDHAAAFYVSDLKIHPYYTGVAGSPNDIAMIRFSGATASTPVIPVMTPAQDKLKANVKLDHIGYGRTESSSLNTIRRHKVKPIYDLNSVYVTFDQSGTSGGLCNGDSGGPSLTLGTELVAGVSSAGFGETEDQAINCNGAAVVTRVSASYDSFIKPFIDGTTSKYSCDECWYSAKYSAGACEDALMTCAYSDECLDYVNCGNECLTYDCLDECAEYYPDGARKYDRIDSCACEKCPQCASEGRCNGAKCGLLISEPTCRGCSHAKCCAQEMACADDADCLECVGYHGYTEFCGENASNASVTAWLECLHQSCSEECFNEDDPIANPGDAGTPTNDKDAADNPDPESDDNDSVHSFKTSCSFSAKDSAKSHTATSHAWLLAGISFALAGLRRRRASR